MVKIKPIILDPFRAFCMFDRFCLKTWSSSLQDLQMSVHANKKLTQFFAAVQKKKQDIMNWKNENE